MTIHHSISICVQAGNAMQTEGLVTQALKENHLPSDILREGLAAGITEMKKKFYRNEILASHVIIAERAMKAGLQILMSQIKKSQSTLLGTVIIGTLEGDIRETEKDIISVMMLSLGLKVIDLGPSISNTRFVEAAIKEKAQLIVCTTSLTIFLPQMESLVLAASQADIRQRTKILLSGGPVTELFCKNIEADLYAPDPLRAAEMAAEYCGKKMRNEE